MSRVKQQGHQADHGPDFVPAHRKIHTAEQRENQILRKKMSSQVKKPIPAGQKG